MLEGIFELGSPFCNIRGLPLPTFIIQGTDGQTPSVLLGERGW